MSIGFDIKNARLAKKMTEKDLAKKIGVAESYIKDIESGRKVIKENLIGKIEKILGSEIQSNQFYMGAEKEDDIKSMDDYYNTPAKKVSKPAEENAVWTNAFGSAFAEVDVVKMDLKTKLSSKLMPIQNSKIENMPKDKVLWLQIEDNEMSGFRIRNNDIAFAHIVKEYSTPGFYLIEWNQQKMIRQVKKLDQKNLLIVSHPSTVRTATADLKEVQFLAKLVRVEFEL